MYRRKYQDLHTATATLIRYGYQTDLCEGLPYEAHEYVRYTDENVNRATVHPDGTVTYRVYRNRR